MHKSSILRMEWFINNYLKTIFKEEDINKPISVLDVGSYDVNGSYKKLFDDPLFSYAGLDIEPGPNVDIVADNPYFWSMIEDESFDVIISGQAFEHIEFFWLTISEMARVLRRSGLICIIVPREQKCHRYPTDCYRFEIDGIIALARYTNLKPLHATIDLAPPGAQIEWYSHNGSISDAMLVAEKPAEWSGVFDCKSYKNSPSTFDELEDLSEGFTSITGQLAYNKTLISQNKELEDHNLALLNSKSWRITKPLRAIKKLTLRDKSSGL